MYGISLAGSPAIQASWLSDLVLNALNLTAGDAAGNRVYGEFGINPIRPDPTTRRQAGLASLAVEAAAVSVAHTIERQLLEQAASPMGLLTALPALFPVAAALGLARGADYLEERAVVRLLQSGVASGERRGELKPSGRLLQWTLHEGLQASAFAIGLGLMHALGIGDWGFFGGDLGVGLQALFLSLGRDAARLVGQRLFPQVYAARAALAARQRAIDVYTRYPPLRPRFDREGIGEWARFARALNFFEEGGREAQVFTGRGRLSITQRPAHDEPFRGLVFFVADTKPAGRRYQKNGTALLEWLFTEKERQDYFARRIIAGRAKNPQKQAGRLTDMIEVKRAIWTFLMDEAPARDRDWDPHEIEIAMSESGLVGFKLSPRLQGRMEALRIGDIQSTFTDSGEMSLGIVSFRTEGGAAPVLGIGIDVEDVRRFLRHAEPGHEAWYDPAPFFPEGDYGEHFADGRRPSPAEIAHRHVVSESLFKAAWPHFPQAHHGRGLYQQFGWLEPGSRWQILKLTGDSADVLGRLRAHHAETETMQIGDAMIAVTIFMDVAGPR